MPTPKLPKTEPSKVEPKEAGASGGAPAEAIPPTPEANEWVEVELVTVNQNGERQTRLIKDLTLTFALNQAASYIIDDIFEAVKEEVLHELPRPRLKAMIFGAKSDSVFKVEVKGNNFTKVYHIPKERAVYYYGGFEIKGFYVYVRIEAVYAPAIRATFYEVILDDNTVKAVGEDLYKMLKGEST
jgi:hypothetical protein